MNQVKNKKPIIFFIHGFKTITWNNYDDFVIWLGEKNTNLDIFTYDYYDNTDKKTLNWKLMWEKNREAFKGIVAQNRDIIIVSYSSGAPISTRLIKEFPEARIKKIFFVAPAFKISLFYIIKKFFSGLFKKVILWFKMNKQQKKRYKRIKNKSVSEPHLYRLIISMIRLQKHTMNSLAEIDVKEIEVFYGDQDITVPFDKNIKFIIKNAKKHNIKVNFHKIKNRNHVSVFTNSSIEEVFEKIIK